MAQGIDDRVVSQGLPDGESHPPFGKTLMNGQGLINGDSHGLFKQQWFAGFGAGAGHRKIEGRGQGGNDAVNLGRGNQILPMGVAAAPQF